MFKKKNKTVSLISGLFLAVLFLSAFAWAGEASKNLLTNHMSLIRTAAETPKYTESDADFLFQSYSNDAFNVHFPNLDEVSTFTVPCPTDAEFGSVSTEIKIDNISAPNVSLIIQENGFTSVDNFYSDEPSAAHFQVEGDGYLENISVFIKNNIDSIGKIKMVLYNATKNGNNYFPNSDVNDYIFLDESDFPSNTNDWHTVSNLHVQLDNSKTTDNVWFIGLWDNNIYGGNCFWWYERDITGGDGDNCISLHYDAAMLSWVIIEDLFEGVDFNLKIGLSPLSNAPKPSEIGLEINGVPIADGVDNSGIWTSENLGMIDADGGLDFELSTDWKGVSCDVTEVHIEYGIFDDDTLAPEIMQSYSGDYTDENPGEITVVATDASGLSFDPSGIYEVPDQPGIYEFTFVATDNDLDRAGDSLTTTIIATIEIIDDDIEAPEITYFYSGDYTDENPGEITVVATDASGLSFDPSGIYEVPDQPGIYEFTFVATDNDLDRAGDSLTTTIIATIEIIDDDIEAPEITYFYSGDYTDTNPGELTVVATDASGLSFDPSGTYQVPDQPGVYEFTFTATDNDLDRAGDSLTTMISVTIEITKEEVITADPLEILEELIDFALDNIEDKWTQRSLLRRFEHLKWEILRFRIDRTCRVIERIERALGRYLDRGDVSEAEMTVMMDLLQEIRDIVIMPVDIVDELIEFARDNIERQSIQRKIVRKLEHLKKNVFKGKTCKACRDIKRIERDLAKYLRKGHISESEMDTMMESLQQIKDIICNSGDIFDGFFRFLMENLGKKCREFKKYFKHSCRWFHVYW